MTKMISKQVSFILALFMIMATVVSAIMPAKGYAEEGKYTLTLKNEGKTEHTFDIYQIFKGDLSGETLSNIKWGEGIKPDSQDSLGDAAQKAETIKDENGAKNFAEEVQEHLSLVKKSKSLNPGETGEVTDLEPGYYLVKDQAKSQEGKENGAYTSYILKVVKNTEAKTKLDVPTVKKEVKENSNSQWGKAADYNIGDSVPFKLTGTLPTNFDKYEKYEYTFHDEMSEGLTFEKDSLKVTIDGKTVDKSNYILGSNNHGFKLTFGDLKKIPGVTKDSKILVEYFAKLNEKAVIGGNGNDNTVYLEYSNNPNKGGDGETGTTPKDKNIVFTYKVLVNKKDEKNQPLQGAEFELYKQTDKGEEKIARFTIDEIMDGNKSTFTFKGLDAGKYILKESKTPEGYNTIKPVEFTITADYDKNSADPKLKNLTGTTDLGSLKFTPETEKGSLSTDVVNKKGFTLPETGGMGRTIIYVAGVAFVVAALGYMGVKRRKNHAVK